MRHRCIKENIFIRLFPYVHLRLNIPHGCHSSKPADVEVRVLSLPARGYFNNLWEEML